MFNSSKSKALITPHTIIADNFAMRSRNQERGGQVMNLGGWLLDSYWTLRLLQKPSKEHDSSPRTMSRQSRQIYIYIYIYTSIHALVPNGLLHEVRAHEWHCRQKWGTENTYVICLLFFCSVSSSFKPRTEIPMKGVRSFPHICRNCVFSPPHDNIYSYQPSKTPPHNSSPQTSPYKEQIHRQSSHFEGSVCNLKLISPLETQNNSRHEYTPKP